MKPLADIVELARQGDSAAFEEIVLRFKDNAQARAYAVLRDHQLAEDAVQEAFTEAYVSLDKLREPAAFPGWFKRIVIKRIDRLIRKKQLPTTSLEQAFAVAWPGEEAGDLIDDEAAASLVREGVENLPEHERDIARDYYFESLPQKDVAKAAGVPVTTVKKRLHTSRQRLKGILDSSSFEDTAPLGDGLPAVTQLYAAARHGFAAKAQRIIEDNPTLVNTVNEDGVSILLHAAHASHQSGITGVADLLIVKGAPLDIFSAAALGLKEVVAAHLRSHPERLVLRGPWGRQIHHWAASGGHRELVQWLLALEADVHAADAWGCTSLHLAAETGQLETVRLLLEHGSDSTARLRNGKSSVHIAAQNGHFGVVEELLRKDAQMDVFVATSLGWEDVVGRMLRKDPFLAKVRLPYGATPLHIAAEDGQLRMAEFLVDEGAELDMVCAAELGWKDEIKNMLAEKPKGVNAKSGSFGFTALHSATAKGRRDLAQILLANGAEVNATDDMYNKTPLGEALYYGNESLARLLFEHGAEV